MVAMGLAMLAFFVLAVIFSLRNDIQHQRWFLKFSVWMIPVPFLACEFGWLVAELGSPALDRVRDAADLDVRVHAQRGLHDLLAGRLRGPVYRRSSSPRCT